MKSLWNDTVIAKSDQTIVVEGNHYFPPDAIHSQYFLDSDTNTVCPWKGTASYYTVSIDGDKNVDAAWYYPEPKSAASEIKDHVAFWRGVQVVD